MSKLLTAAQMRAAEQMADCEGLSQAQLMENAGEAAARQIAEHARPGNAVIVCGKGNNGGDGMLCGIALRRRGFTVTLVLACQMPSSPAAQLALERAEDAGLPLLCYLDEPEAAAELICRADLLVDALFGTGFSGEITAPYDEVIGVMNTAHAVKFALDLPSGCRGDDATVADGAFCADYTVAFGACKPAHYICPAARLCGVVEPDPIGIPAAICESVGTMELADAAWVGGVFPRRADPYSHKGDYGRLLLLAGSPGMAGAAKLAASAALRSGAGLVELATDKRIGGAITAWAVCALTNFYAVEAREVMSYGAIAPGEPERLLHAAHKATAVAAGCGWGCGADRAALLTQIADETDCPLLLDADALNSFAASEDRGEAFFIRFGQRLLLTPHPGEFARLIGESVETVLEHKLEYVRRFAASNGVTLLLKGYDTLVTDGEKTVLVRAGSPGMAKGGSGDVLAGAAGALLGQGLSPMEAAVTAAWCCAKAGEAAAERLGAVYAGPEDTIEALSGVYRDLERV